MAFLSSYKQVYIDHIHTFFIGKEKLLIKKQELYVHNSEHKVS